jgi:hypothetical protein
VQGLKINFSEVYDFFLPNKIRLAPAWATSLNPPELFTVEEPLPHLILDQADPYLLV